MSLSIQIQKGVSLVELMLAVFIGLLLTLAISAIYIELNKSVQSQSEKQALQNNALFALERVGQAIRTAGFQSVGVLVEADRPAAIELLSLPKPQGDFSDKLLVRFWPDGMSGSFLQDCAGGRIETATPIENTFYVKAESGKRALWCYSSLSKKEVLLASDIEGFRAWLIQDGQSDLDRGKVLMLSAQSAEGVVKGVRGVKMAFLVKSRLPSVSRPAPAYQESYEMFGEWMPSFVEALPFDGQAYLRQVFVGSQFVRNPD